MKLIAPHQSFSNFAQNQNANWRQRAGGCQLINQPAVAMRQIQRSPLQKKPDGKNIPPELCVEDIQVYADRKYMYCKGIVRSHGSRARSNLVVAVEWLDENQKALNTDWERIETHLEGKRSPLFPNTIRPFMIKAPLDRRVKWVKAYAFSSTHAAS
jgi:hypothetical protein